MSGSKNSVQAFIQILESQSNLISTLDWDELQQLSTNLPDDDDEEIAERIENWLKTESRSQIFQAYKQNLKSLSSSSPINLNVGLGIGGTKSPTPPHQPSPSSKELIENAIKRNSPLSDNTKTNQKP